MTYDVIVAGAGPSGSAAARVLAAKGFTVLLLDRSSFPREKICGDGLTPGTVKLLNELGVLSLLSEDERYPIRAIRFATPHLQILDVPFSPKHEGTDFLVVPRKVLDQALWQKAVESGAQFKIGHVRKVLRNSQKVVGVSVEIDGKLQNCYSNVVIGADGATSVVARSLNKRRMAPQHRFLALRTYVKGFKTLPGLAEFYWTNELRPGYFWIFPLGQNQANIGLGLPADLYAQSSISLKERFWDYLNRPMFAARKLPNISIEAPKAWPIPLAGARGMQRVFDGALLVGDAGYWVDPLSGEGIFNALKTGIIAGEVVANALQAKRWDRKFLQQYETRCQEELGGVIRRSLWFVWGMRHAPWLLESYFWLARHNPLAFRKFFSNLSRDFQFKFEKERG